MTRLNERLAKLEASKPKKSTVTTEVTPEMMAGALVLMYDDERPISEIAAMVASGCYSPPVHLLPLSTGQHAGSGERYHLMCR